MEDCPRHDFEENWGCRDELAFAPASMDEWTEVQFTFTATAETMYLIIKVRYDAPVEVNFIEVTDTGDRVTTVGRCKCPPIIEHGNSTSVALESSLLELNETDVTTCIVANCSSALARCEEDDACSTLFPQGLRGYPQDLWHLNSLWDCIDANCPIEASLETKRWIESPCLQDNCFAEIAACESDRECTIDASHPLRSAVLSCEAAKCTTVSPTTMPTYSPTIEPTLGI